MQSIRIKVENVNELEMSVNFKTSNRKVNTIGFINIYLINNWFIIVSMCRGNVKGTCDVYFLFISRDLHVRHCGRKL